MNPDLPLRDGGAWFSFTIPMSPDARVPAAPTSPSAIPSGDDLLEHLRRVTLGEYDVAGQLGQGGMATVYLAHDLALDRKVAIKVMAPGLVYGQGMVERFKREARTAAALSHPNIIPVYSVREVEGLLFFVMKLVQGTPLDAVIKELGPLPIPMVEALLGQVGGALGYAHRQGVVHRDVKPGNIMIDEEGWAIVTDFGIAKVAEAEGLTMTGMSVGTPSYMAPEQCVGGEVDGASDQYALGCVAFEMLTGKPPFSAPTQMALMYSHCHDTPPSLSALRPDCPPVLQGAVERMLAKTSTDRWPTLEDAVASIGLRTLAHNDPTRGQLVALARTGLSHRLISAVQTPRSPIPLTHSHRAQASVDSAVPTEPSIASSKHRSRLLIGGLIGLSVLALGMVTLLGGRDGGEGDTAAASMEILPPGGPGVEVPAVQEMTPVAPPPPPSAPVRPEQRAAAAPDDQRQVAPPPAPAVPPPAPSTPVSSTPPSGVAIAAPVIQTADSVAAITSARAESVVSQPQPVPVRRVEPSTPPPPPVPVAVVPNDAALLDGVLRRYTKALENGDLAAAQTVFPGMPREQRGGLEAFARERANGATLTAAWVLRDVEVTGNSATGRVTGTSTLRRPGEDPTATPVELRIRFERRGSEWIVTALVN